MNAAEKLLDVSHLMKGGVHEKIIINKIGLKPLMLGSILCFFSHRPFPFLCYGASDFIGGDRRFCIRIYKM